MDELWVILRRSINAETLFNDKLYEKLVTFSTGKREVVGSCNVGSLHSPGVTKENHEHLSDRRCPGRDSKGHLLNTSQKLYRLSQLVRYKDRNYISFSTPDELLIAS